MKDINWLYQELANIYSSGDIKGANKFYNEKIVPLLKHEIKEMKEEVEAF